MINGRDPWLTRPTVPSAIRPVKWRWTVEWASPKMPANSAESINGIRLRKWSICRSRGGHSRVPVSRRVVFGQLPGW